MLTASSTRGSNPCIMKICINGCKHVKDFLVLQGIFCSNTQFCKRDYYTPARVYKVIGLHGSCQVSCLRVSSLGEFLSLSVFYPQEVNVA
jgi:hypothetical protein